MPLLDWDPGQSPEAPGTLHFYEQGQDPSTGFQVTSRGVITAPGGTSGPVSYTGAATDDAVAVRVTGDTQPRLVVDADGTFRWGSGSGAADISMNRYAAGGLEISGALRFTNGQLLFGPGGDVNLYRGVGTEELKTDDNLNVSGTLTAGGALTLANAGSGLQVKEGANACMGVATLVAGTIVVSTTKVTANSRIFLTVQTPGGSVGSPRISARSAGTSFTITSSQGTDTSTVAWLLVEPSP